MATNIETQVTWGAGATSKTVNVNTVIWTDSIAVDPNDGDGSLQVHADNQGTPASGDTCQPVVGYSNGDILENGGDDFDSDEHYELLGPALDTYPSATPGEDPARKTYPVDAAGKKAVRFGVICPQATSRNILVRMRFVTQRS